MLFITPYEREALRLVARNRTTTEVAACLGIDVVDVGSHLSELFSRMGASSATEALARACRRGLIESGVGSPDGGCPMRRPAERSPIRTTCRCASAAQ